MRPAMFAVLLVATPMLHAQSISLDDCIDSADRLRKSARELVDQAESLRSQRRQSEDVKAAALSSQVSEVTSNARRTARDCAHQGRLIDYPSAVVDASARLNALAVSRFGSSPTRRARIQALSPLIQRYATLFVGADANQRGEVLDLAMEHLAVKLGDAP